MITLYIIEVFRVFSVLSQGAYFLVCVKQAFLDENKSCLILIQGKGSCLSAALKKAYIKLSNRTSAFRNFCRPAFCSDVIIVMMRLTFRANLKCTRNCFALRPICQHYYLELANDYIDFWHRRCSSCHNSLRGIHPLHPSRITRQHLAQKLIYHIHIY